MKKRIYTLWIALLAVAGAAAQPAVVLTREECRTLALACSEQLRQRQNGLTAATLDRKTAQAQYLPQVDGSFTLIYSDDIDMGTSTLLMRGVYDAGLTLQQPVFAGGRIVAAGRLARIGERTAGEQLRQTRMQVLADVDNAYFTLLAVREKVKMLEAYRRQMDELYRSVENHVQAEMAIRNELLRVEAKRTEIDYQLQKARNGEHLCRMSLCQLVGLELTADVRTADSVLAVAPPEGLDENIDARPELRLLHHQLEARRQQVRMERAVCLPTVGLGLGYSYMGHLVFEGTATGADGAQVPFKQTYDEGYKYAMLSVNVPLFHWGSNWRKVKKARLELENARLDLQRNTRLMTIEARQAVQNLTDGYRMVHTAVQGREQADENLRVMRQQYDNGMAVLTDLLDAQAQWQQARSNLIEAQTQYKLYETEYLRVTGRL